MNKLYSYKRKIIGFTFIVFALVMSLNPAMVFAASYGDVSQGSWRFFIDEYNTSKYIVANYQTDVQGVTQYSVFAYSVTEDGVAHFEQMPDRNTNRGGDTVDCAAHIDIPANSDGEFTGRATLWTLDGCSGSRWSKNDTDIKTPVPQDISQKLVEDGYTTSVIRNYGNDYSDQIAADREAQKEGTDDITCGDVGGVGGWFLCWIGDLGSSVISLVDDVLYSLLEIPIATWEQSGAKAAWGTMRTISSTLIVLVLLVGIASQIFSFDFISAYTIKKILPKLFIAVILIQLSWFLGVTAIEISNTVGYSIQSLIMAPFIETINTQMAADGLKYSASDWVSFSDVFKIYAINANHPAVTSAGASGVLLLAAGGGIGAAVGAGPAIILIAATALLSGAMALFVAFVVIVLRYVLILGLLIVVPLALVAWILPNTSKWFDRWWGLFFTLLAMFPIIIAFLSFGKAAAIIIALGAGA